jgi:putative heme iron utilization protein
VQTSLQEARLFLFGYHPIDVFLQNLVEQNAKISESELKVLNMSEVSNDVFSKAVSDRICKHMNEDHAAAILMYAQVFGQATEATGAEMRAIDAEGMDLNAQVNGEPVSLRIPFDHVLKDAEDAHHTLIDLVKQARSKG